MTFDPDKLMAHPFADLRQTYAERDTILYALGLGCGHDPMDEADLRFVYEDGLKALPTMAVVLGYPGFWIREAEAGIDWQRLLHGEQRLVLHRPLAPAASVIGRTRLTGLVDKGPGRGVLLYSERDVVDAATGDLLCTLGATTFLRAEGGFGGATGPVRAPHTIPDRAPDTVLDLPTLPQAALIYRLSGDWNPLHADPKVAAAAKFPRPILHGLCSYGIAGRAVLRAACDDDPARLRALDVRFSAPVYPGETIRTELWRDGEIVSFRARVVERDVVVIHNGRAVVGE